MWKVECRGVNHIWQWIQIHGKISYLRMSHILSYTQDGVSASADRLGNVFMYHIHWKLLSMEVLKYWYGGPLKQTDQKYCVDVHQYWIPRNIRVLDTVLIPFLSNDSVVMQDGAPCHRSRSTLDYPDSRSICLISDWPAQSPDLNIIENLWSVLKSKVTKRMPKTDGELWSVTQEEWIL